MAEDVRRTVESELKRRYSWLGLIMAVIMGSLLTLTVRELLFDARVKLEVMDEFQKLASERLGETTSQSEKLSAQLVDLQEEARSISNQLAQAAETSLNITDEHRTEVANLSGVVGKLNSALAKQTAEEPDRRVQADLNRRIESIDTALRRSGDDIKTAIEQTKKAKY